MSDEDEIVYPNTFMIKIHPISGPELVPFNGITYIKKELSINYDILYNYAFNNNISYNELCSTVKLALGVN